MPIELRLLNVEDSEDDALQLVRFLRKAGYAVTFERVDTPEAMEAALEGGHWDVVVTDYVLPSFSAPAAVAMLRDRRLNVPVVLVSGAVLDDVMAMEALRSGAQDYLAKTYLSRLVPAIGLVAGVLPERQRAGAHLALCQEYLNLPEPLLTKAVYHGEQAMESAGEQGQVDLHAQALLSTGKAYVQLGWATEAVGVLERFLALRDLLDPRTGLLEGEVLLQLGLALEALGDREGTVRSLRHAVAWFQRRGVDAKAAEAAEHLAALEHNTEIPLPPMDPFSGLIGRAEYHLLAGEHSAAVRRALEALNEAGNDSYRCYQCYSLLMRSARVQGHLKDALNFALSARMTALEAGRYDLAFRVSQAFGEVRRDLGPEGEQILAEVVREYRLLGVDITKYIPESF